MSRSYHSVLTLAPNRRCALALFGALLFPGCSLSVPMWGENEAPATTGSLAAAPVKVQQPLPQTLAYSDATKIGQAAVSALTQVDNGSGGSVTGGEWVNAATGSSGTVERGVAEASSSGGCSAFNTIVTSIGGVHRYAGKVCRSRDGRSVVEIAAPGEAPSA